MHRRRPAVVLEGPGLYRLGVIDLLQEWNLKKRGERLGKILFKGRFAKEVKDGMSAIELQTPAPKPAAMAAPSAVVSTSFMAMRAKVVRMSCAAAIGSGLPLGPSGLT